MKKVLVFLVVLAFAVLSFAATKMDVYEYGKVYGKVEFGLKMTSKGIGLDFGADNWPDSYTFKTIFLYYLDKTETDDGATLTVSVSYFAPDRYKKGDISIDSISYEDALMSLNFVNDGYDDTFSPFTFVNYNHRYKAKDPDWIKTGYSDDPIGNAYLEANIKSIDLDLLYIDFDDSAYPDEEVILRGDAFGVKKSFDLGTFDLDAAGAFWAAGDRDAATPTQNFLGYAAEAQISGKDTLKGLSVDAVFGAQSSEKYNDFKKNAMRLNASYSKAFEAGIITVSPFVNFKYQKGLMDLPFTDHVTTDAWDGCPSLDASKVYMALPVKADLGIAGNLEVKLHGNVYFAKDKKPAYEAYVNYSNKIADLANIDMVKVTKVWDSIDATAMKLRFSAKVSGKQTFDMVTAGYKTYFRIPDLMDKPADTYFLYANPFVTVKPVDKVTLEGNVYYAKDASDSNTKDDFGYKLEAKYNPSSLITFGAEVHNRAFNGWTYDSDFGFYNGYWFYWSGTGDNKVSWSAYIKGEMEF
ncbi:hypothetical protein [Marinitoga sp. 1138]|uniref:hypothetical protein n=1 Tax=Marinitoga sp. 1138 TaxID=1643334 RepID=UPI001586C7C1|nr:hypothetical protein [Marinitoga sp. 1138]NUU98219.1 hypothetical protein [Marinitoga sp. 1138]